MPPRGAASTDFPCPCRLSTLKQARDSPPQQIPRKTPGHKSKKGLHPKIEAFFNLIPAATYVPTQLPMQYHRLGEA